jgi:hypothetical protein
LVLELAYYLVLGQPLVVLPWEATPAQLETLGQLEVGELERSEALGRLGVVVLEQLELMERGRSEVQLGPWEVVELGQLEPMEPGQWEVVGLERLEAVELGLRLVVEQLGHRL